jgi:hypothetical protein
MMPLPKARLAAFLLLAPAACATGPSALLPPLAQVEVPVIEHKEVPKPKPSPAVLVGQTEDQVLAFLGTPDLRRREAPAEIWRYGDEDCGVHLFFYDADGAMSVRHVDTRLARDSDLTEAECLDTLRHRAVTE